MSEPHPGPVGSQAPGAARTHIQLPPCLLLLLPLLSHPLRPLRLSLPPVLLFFLLRQVFKVRSDVTCFAVHYKGSRDLPRVMLSPPHQAGPGDLPRGPRHWLRGTRPFGCQPSLRQERAFAAVSATHAAGRWAQSPASGTFSCSKHHYMLYHQTFTRKIALGRSSIEQSEAMTELHPRNVSCDRTGGPGTPRGPWRTGRGASGENTCN